MHRFCPVCNTRYDAGETFCAQDGAELQEPGHGHAGNLVGTTVADRYEVVAQIATGGMGVIYKARQKMLDRSVALKVLPRELANDADTERRFFNEARAISQLRHPHIVTLFDFGRTVDRKLFIAMEYVNGEPLAVHIENRPLPVDTAVRIADQVLDALAEAHRAGIIHRDIKPDNVMLEVRNGRLFVRLLDFGIAKSDFDTARLTKTGIVFGTPEYISPEQVLGKPSDLRVDLYAVGLILFEMLSGHRPFGGSGTAIAYKHGHDPVPSLLKKYPGLQVPPQLDRLIFRLMSKDPADRPGSAEDVRRLLLDASLGADLSYASGPLPSLDFGGLPPPPLALDDLDALGRIGGELDPFGHEAPPAPPMPRSQALTVSSRPPHPGAPPVAEVATDPPVGNHPSIDRALGPRPPQLSIDAPATVQVPLEMLRAQAPSRRPLVLGALLAIIGLGSLSASMWIDRPFPLQPLPPRPVPTAAIPVGPTHAELLDWSEADRLEVRLRPTPARLRGRDDPALLPLPAGITLPDGAAERRQAVADARASLAALDEHDPGRRALLRRVGDLQWAAANGDYVQALAEYEDASSAYLNGARDVPPAVPVPAYGDAIVAYEQLIDAAPEAADDWLLAALGHGLVGAGRRADGQRTLRGLIERFPESPYVDRARALLAEQALAADDPAGALPHLEALASGAADGLMALHAQFRLGYVYGSLGRHEDAVDGFQRSIEATRAESEAARFFRPRALDGLTLAYSHVPGGQRQAVSYFRGLGGEALARRQSRLLAMIYAARGEPAEAAAAWREALDDLQTPIEGPGDRADALVRLAEQEAAAGHIEPALAVLDGPLGHCAVFYRHPSGIDCRLTRANVLLVARRMDEARAAFEPIAARRADGPLAEAVAEARFRLAEVDFRAFDADPPVGEALAAAVAAVDGAYARVTEPAVDQWQVAADCRRGQLHARYAELLQAAGAEPRSVEASRTRAMDHFAAAERRARDARVETRWAQAASAQLQAMRGAEGP